MITRNCRGCGQAIHPMRLEILPDTRVCVKCSQEGRKSGRLVTLGRGEEIETIVEIIDSRESTKAFKLEDNSRKELSEQDLDFLRSSDDDDDTDIDYSIYSSSDEDEEDE